MALATGRPAVIDIADLELMGLLDNNDWGNVHKMVLKDKEDIDERNAKVDAMTTLAKATSDPEGWLKVTFATEDDGDYDNHKFLRHFAEALAARDNIAKALDTEAVELHKKFNNPVSDDCWKNVTALKEMLGDESA